ncbi:MAG: MFS transporter [Rhodospirillales bacterium]|nr:MAG: MFS transporter [Rhodospirillales bacterium]
MPDARQYETFYGWRVVAAAFVLAMFGLGMGFHGPPIYLHAVRETRGWSLPLVSTAITVHFLVGAAVTACLPAFHRRFGIARTTKVGALALALGVLGWATVVSPWQLFVAALLSGAGWVTMGVAAINAIVSPWFVRARPAALAMAYNGANIGGVVFAPLWAVAIGQVGFPAAAAMIGAAMVLVIWILADRVFSRTPEGMGMAPDGDVAGAAAAPNASSSPRPLPGSQLWHDAKFQTLAAAMALGLFAQIGVIAHLYSLMVPALGARDAGLAMALVPAMAVAGRTCIGWLLPAAADRRLVASASYAVQIAASVVFIAGAGVDTAALLLGVVLFGLAFGNGTWLPPLIAQTEFAKEDVPRVVALIVAMAQAAYAFAPAVFGLVREVAPRSEAHPGDAPYLFVLAALAQGLAIAAFLVGRRK